MKSSGRKLAWLAPAFLLLLAMMPTVAASPPASTPLNLSIRGGIVDSGQQTYVQTGGVLSCNYCFASVLGEGVYPTANLRVSVFALTHELETSGFASVNLMGVMANGTSFSILGVIKILGGAPAEVFPVGCTTTCASQIPAFFLGGGTFFIKVSHSWSAPLQATIESAFLNPFGGAIVWSLEGPSTSILLVFDYSSATIDWQNVQTQGVLLGTLGATQVGGLFNQTTSAHEDLLSGTETETGAMTFYQMTSRNLDGSGHYSGRSTIPTAGELDCSSETTGIPGTCTLTGFNSAGHFTLDPAGSIIQGTYNLQWAVPALGFVGTATGTLSQCTHCHS